MLLTTALLHTLCAFTLVSTIRIIRLDHVLCLSKHSTFNNQVQDASVQYTSYGILSAIPEREAVHTLSNGFITLCSTDNTTVHEGFTSLQCYCESQIPNHVIIEASRNQSIVCDHFNRPYWTLDKPAHAIGLESMYYSTRSLPWYNSNQYYTTLHVSTNFTIPSKQADSHITYSLWTFYQVNQECKLDKLRNASVVLSIRLRPSAKVLILRMISINFVKVSGRYNHFLIQIILQTNEDWFYRDISCRIKRSLPKLPARMPETISRCIGGGRRSTRSSKYWRKDELVDRKSVV